MYVSRPIVALITIVLAVACLAAWQRPAQILATSVVASPAVAPQRIVNLSGMASQFPVATLYSVPADAWLVVTDADFDHGDFDLGLVDQNGYRRVLLGDRNFDSYRSSVGLAFPPGSQVVLALRTSGFSDANWNLTGYLTRP